MKNVFMKNHIMNNTKSDKEILNILGETSLIYRYQFSTTTFESRDGDYVLYPNKNYFNKLFKPFERIPVEYYYIKFNMIVCPSGDEVYIDEWQNQRIKEPFMLGETEITQELFDLVMYSNPSGFKDSVKNPVENVTWLECIDFCNKLSNYFNLDNCYTYDKYSTENSGIVINSSAKGFRLPREWEWQIAAMAGTSNDYAGAGDEQTLGRVAWLEANSGKKTHPVAQKLPNEWGFYDMSGNVYEWCENALVPIENNQTFAKRSFRGGYFGKPDVQTTRRPTLKISGNRSLNAIGFRVAKSI